MNDKQKMIDAIIQEIVTRTPYAPNSQIVLEFKHGISILPYNILASLHLVLCGSDK